MEKAIVNWNEPPLTRWLGTTTRKGTQHIYRSAFRRYAMYTGMTATQLIDEALEDAKRDIRERKDILKTRLLGFHKWLITEYPVSSRGKGEHIIERKGLREKTAYCFVGAIRSFYGTYDLNVKLKGRQAIRRPRVYNKRMQLTPVEIKALVDHARSPRDRAIILTLFQGGMDVSTLCSIKYADVAKGLDANEHPLKVELFREKTGTDYYTFLGRDAIESIKAYLNDAKSRGIEFKPNTPLFTKETGKGEPMDTFLVQKVLRETAIRCGLVDKENNGKDMNPVSPHALRESFGSLMINNGVPDTVVDFWLGHNIGEMGEAYKGARFAELKAMYSDKERFISVSTPESEVIEGLRKEVDERNKQLQTLVTGLTTENLEMKAKVAKLEKALDWTVREIRIFQKETLERMGESTEVIEEAMRKHASRKEDYLK